MLFDLIDNQRNYNMRWRITEFDNHEVIFLNDMMQTWQICLCLM